MKIKQRLLIEDLAQIVDRAIASAKAFKELPVEDLNAKKEASQWSILECLEHLNLYGDYYLPEIEKQLLKGRVASEAAIFKSGMIGNYFANLMKVNDGKIKKMKSPRDKNPVNSKLNVLVIDRFLKQSQKLKVLLKQSLEGDLTKIKVPISITKFVKLRLGDTLRFYVYHIERHILQAKKNVKEIQNEEQSILI